MWENEQREWPALGNQVIGVVELPNGFDAVAWWTRTEDGWYVSEHRGNLGHRDAMTKEASMGPDWWIHPPHKT